MSLEKWVPVTISSHERRWCCRERISAIKQHHRFILLSVITIHVFILIAKLKSQIAKTSPIFKNIETGGGNCIGMNEKKGRMSRC